LLDCLGSTNRASNENLAPLLVLGAAETLSSLLEQRTADIRALK
jgi:hypothetical protein